MTDDEIAAATPEQLRAEVRRLRDEYAPLVLPLADVPPACFMCGLTTWCECAAVDFVPAPAGPIPVVQGCQEMDLEVDP